MKQKKSKILKLIVISIISVMLVSTFALSQDAFQQDIYEDDDTSQKANNIILNLEVQRHNFHDSGDEDWVKFYGIPEMRYVIDVINLEDKCDAVIELYDSDGIAMLAQKDETPEGKMESLEWNKFTKDDIYYIKVKNYYPEQFGKDTEYDLRIAYGSGNDGPMDGIIEGYAVDITSCIPIKTAKIKTDFMKEPATVDDEGYYDILHHPGKNYTLTAEADGYESQSAVVDVKSLYTITYNFFMKPEQPPDYSLGLCHLILSLQVLVGINTTEQKYIDNLDGNCDGKNGLDMNCNGKVGLADAIYILQKVSGVR